MNDTILEVRHLSKAFGSHQVLKDIDFTVRAGDVTSIIGASGSGKSTLLRLLERRLDGSDSYELAQADQLVMAAGTYSHPGHGTPFDEQSPEYRERLRQSFKNRNGSTRGDR